MSAPPEVLPDPSTAAKRRDGGGEAMRLALACAASSYGMALAKPSPLGLIGVDPASTTMGYFSVDTSAPPMTDSSAPDL